MFNHCQYVNIRIGKAFTAIVDSLAQPLGYMMAPLVVWCPKPIMWNNRTQLQKHKSTCLPLNGGRVATVKKYSVIWIKKYHFVHLNKLKIEKYLKIFS